MSLPFGKTLPLALLTLFSSAICMAQVDCVNNPTTGDPPLASFFNTGTDGAGGTLPGGSPDLNWTMSTTGINGPYSPAIVMDPVPAAYYTSPWPDCAWIAHQADGFQVGNLDVYYKFTFTLACFNSCHESYSDPGVFCLSLDFFADNAVSEIFVNGVLQNIAGMPVADPYNYQGYIQANMVTVSLCDNWQPGTNELIIHVQSGPPYEGFLAQASTNVPPPISDTAYATICNGDDYVFGPDILTAAGVYTHTFATQFGCDSLVTLILSVNPSYNTTTIDTICNGDSVLFAGTYYHTSGLYTYNGTTALGCDSITHLQLTVNTVTAIPSFTNVLCYGEATGSIDVNAQSNPPGYTYALDNGPYGTSNHFGNLLAGTYTVHTKAANGCIKDTTVTISQPTQLSIPGIATVEPLCSYSFGTFTVTSSGGTPAYTYAIDAGPYTTNNVFNGVAIGNYVIHVKDANGCIKDTAVTMNGPAVLGASISITNEPCHGQTLGAINVTGTGGTAPYTYALDAGSFGGGSFTGLGASSYVVHVQDVNNCLFDTTVQVTEPASLGSTVTYSEPKCYGDTNGYISLIPNGGTQPFTYSLNGGPFTGNNAFTGLGASIDSISIVDNNGCTIDTVLILVDPDPIRMVDVLTDNIRCAGGSDGIIQPFAVGGIPPYTFAIDANFFTSNDDFTGLAAGQHTIHIKDHNDCTLDSIIELSQPPVLNFDNVIITDAACAGTSTGTVSLNGTGGTPPYMYATDTVNFTKDPVFSGLSADTYHYYMQDSAGCMTDTLITVGENAAIIIGNASISSPSCYNTDDATLTINASGGVPPLRYQLDNNPLLPGSNNLFTGLAAGSHTITVTDSNNCSQTNTTTILQPAELKLQLYANGNPCEGVDDNGAVHVRTSGGTPPYTYTWSTDPTESSYHNGITGLPNGTYSVTVTDEHNCTAFGQATVGYDNCCTPDVPNAFTPNNDGKNDYFRARFKGNMWLEKMTIFNRYGQAIYSTSNLQEGWDGTYNGVAQDIGTYYYYIEFYCGKENFNKQILKGDVTLIR